MVNYEKRFAKIKSSTNDIISSKSILSQREKELKSLKWEPSEAKREYKPEDRVDRAMSAATKGAKWARAGMQKGRKGVKAGAAYTGFTSFTTGISKLKRKGKRSRFARYDPGIRLNSEWF